MKKSQKTYSFTLVLKNVDENTPKLEDHLYEAGCDDTLINFRDSTVYLDFGRKSASFEEAVISAIRQVETTDAIVASVAPEDWVTESDIAKRLQIKRQAVSLWIKGRRRKSTPFPKPVMKLSDRSPLWKWHEIAEWLYQNNIIEEKELVQNALFIQNVNGALEERDASVRNMRHRLLKQFQAHGTASECLH